MNKITINNSMYKWMVDLITVAQEPVTTAQIARKINKTKNGMIHCMAMMKKFGIPYSKTRYNHEVEPKYQVEITLEDFINSVTVKGLKVQKENKKNNRSSKQETSDDGCPWYIISTECKVIYKSKIVLTKRNGVINCKQLY